MNNLAAKPRRFTCAKSPSPARHHEH